MTDFDSLSRWKGKLISIDTGSRKIAMCLKLFAVEIFAVRGRMSFCGAPFGYIFHICLYIACHERPQFLSRSHNPVGDFKTGEVFSSTLIVLAFDALSSG